MRFLNLVSTLACVLLATTLAHSDASAGVYKIIGPDGKVSFSDKPPADAAASDKIDVIRTQTAPLQSSPTNSPSGTSQSVSTAASKGSVKQAVSASAAPSNAAIAPADLAIEKAVIGVLGYEDLVKKTEELCVRTLPSSYQKYSGAADGWRSRNASLVSRANQTLATQFNASQRQNIEDGIRAKNKASLQPVVNAPTASIISWCDSSSDAIKGGTMDVYNKSNLSAPLTKTGS